MARQSLLHHLFADLASQVPDAVAVRDDRREVGYGELDGSANRLARLLLDHGVGQGSLVGVDLPDHGDLPLAVLGVWRAGAAVVPRVAEPTEVDFLLTHDVLARIESFPSIDPGIDVVAQDAAWVSDGLVISHATLFNHVQWTVRRHQVTAADRFLHTGAVESSFWTLFAALASGASVTIAPAEGLARAVADNQVTVLTVSAEQLASTALDRAWKDCTELRVVLCSGSSADATVCQRLVTRTNAKLWTVYTIADGAIALAAQPFDGSQTTGVLPLGRPFDNVRLLVLDELGDPVPPGVPGELTIGGLAVGISHLRDPELTADRFLPALFGPAGSRMVRTGELVRWRNDGTLEHLGSDAVVQPQQAAPTSRPPYVAPTTAAEQAVAKVWSELLEVRDVGLDDNFFQLGGYSLILAQLAERLRAATGKQVLLADLFAAVTVKDQAALVGADAREVAPILPAPRDQPLPLSFGQRRLWFLDQMHPNSPEWVAPLFLRLPADFTTETVQSALDIVAQRHEVLRTRYVSQAGEPAQIVDPATPAELRTVDCDRDELVKLCGEQFQAEFDLGSGKIWRALLARVPGEEQILLVTVHHIAFDGWSASVLEDELRRLCAGIHAGLAPELPEVAVQYADFAAWQQKWHTKEQLSADLDYWREALDGMTPLELPTDHARPAERDPRGGISLFTVPSPVVDAVTKLGQQHEATPFMTLLTAFNTLLARYTGQWDVVVGTPVAGRTHAEVKSVLGFFLNSLVLRSELDADLTFEQALDRVRATCLSAFAHQEVPFEHLVEELRPERDLSRTPLYQVAFNLHDDQLISGMPDRADIEHLSEIRQVAKTDLTLYIRREGNGTWTGAFEYATALFEQSTIDRLAEHFLRLLESVTANPGSALSEVDILPAGERSVLLDQWNNTGTEWPAQSVIELFEASVATTPDAVAVVAGETRLSYRELDERANQIGHRLQELGAGPDTLVGVCLHRGPDLVASLLGVWKAGAAYVPLDPTNPADRLEHVLTDSGAPILITSPGLVEHYTGHRVDPTDISSPVTQPVRIDDPALLAYVIYTSGSTGRPKGATITHHGLANHLRWAARDLAVGDGGAPLFSSIAFDLPATNLYTPLITGQPVHLMPADLDLSDLGTALVESGPYSFIKLTPGHLDLLTHQLTREQAAGLAGLVLVAGEALPSKLANQLLDILGPDRLINEYGPTEASIGSTIYPVQQPHIATVPLGGPLPNTTAHILDTHGHLVPVGVAGELHVGGDGLARGYLNRPDLTGEKFIPNPFGDSRLYRTGDLARRLPDGSIEFLGRIDTQVKIRGYRIELGEIESVLREHSDVTDTVVMAREDKEGEKTLVAYLTTDGTAPEVSQLREHLAASLPDYMIPTAFLVIDTIPLTSNGKTNYRALPAPDLSSRDYVAPTTATEERLAEIWAEILELDRVSVDDSFFDLGGHSILAIRMTARLQDEFDIDLSIGVVFERFTVRRLAEAIEDLIRAEIEQLTESELIENQMLLREQEA